jgi:hypothetical protein
MSLTYEENALFQERWKPANESGRQWAGLSQDNSGTTRVIEEFHVERSHIQQWRDDLTLVQILRSAE